MKLKDWKKTLIPLCIFIVCLFCYKNYIRPWGIINWKDPVLRRRCPCYFPSQQFCLLTPTPILLPFFPILKESRLIKERGRRWNKGNEKFCTSCSCLLLCLIQVQTFLYFHFYFELPGKRWIFTSLPSYGLYLVATNWYFLIWIKHI